MIPLIHERRSNWDEALKNSHLRLHRALISAIPTTAIKINQDVARFNAVRLPA